jgi:hypothetical protein
LGKKSHSPVNIFNAEKKSVFFLIRLLKNIYHKFTSHLDHWWTNCKLNSQVPTFWREIKRKK